jgi:hypothetical protein
MMGNNMYGPVGFTTIARCILWPYMTDTTTDVERFDGAPAAVAERAMLSLPVSAQQIQLEQDPPIDELVQLAMRLPDAHLHGYIVAPSRDDERLHFHSLCWVARPEPLPELLASYMPASFDTDDDGWIHVWWH